VIRLGEGNRPRGTLPRRETRMCCAIVCSAHQREREAISGTEGEIGRIGIGVGARSGRFGLTGVEGSIMCPISPLACIREFTASSQAKKSCFEVRTGTCVTLGKVFERAGRDEDGEEEEERRIGCKR
jgi:hypothetical protein